MKRTYKDLTNDQLADLHRAALGLMPVTVVRINRSCENLEEHPFVATRTDDTPDVIIWWIEDNTMSVTDSVLTVDYIAAADRARQFDIGTEITEPEEQSRDLQNLKSVYADADPRFKEVWDLLCEARMKTGWKDFYFMVLKMQKESSNNSAYQLKQSH